MKRIMTVDDSLTMRRYVRLALEPEGYEVTEAKDGEDALAKLQGEEVDGFLVDINMPKMSGFDLIRKIRALEQYRFVPILFVTTESDPDKRQEGKEAGATGWIVKPFKREDLINVVRKVVR